MRKIDIPHDDWTAALDWFTAVHDAWLVSLHVFTPECGAQVAFEDLPLISISADHLDDDTVRVSVEEPGGHLFTHAVSQPKRLWVERTDEGADSALVIETSGGATAILKLRSAVLPETVDGVTSPSSRSTLPRGHHEDLP